MYIKTYLLSYKQLKFVLNKTGTMRHNNVIGQKNDFILFLFCFV